MRRPLRIVTVQGWSLAAWLLLMAPAMSGADAPPLATGQPAPTPAPMPAPAPAPASSPQGAQPPPAALPADVDPVTRSRLPAPRPEELDDLGRRQLASMKETGDSAPRTIRLYSSKVGEYMTMGNQYLRYGSGMDPQLREIAILLAARAMDQQYEWWAHEKAAREAGVPQAVIDRVRDGTPIAGIADDRQAILIQLGREVLNDHHVEPDTFARALTLFGKKGLVDLVSLIGHYTATGILLTVFDQHLPPNERPGLEPRRPGRPD